MPVPIALASNAKIEPRIAPAWIGANARSMKVLLVPYGIDICEVEMSEASILSLEVMSWSVLI